EARIVHTLGMETPEQLRAELLRVRELVAANFADLIADRDAAAQNAPDQKMTDIWQGLFDEEKALSILAARGYQQPQDLLQALTVYRASRQWLALEKNSRERMDRFVPLLLARLARESNPDLGFTR